MERLHNPIRGYAWGSRSVIAALQGRPVPSEGPEAELWIGAHPSTPSMMGTVPLSDVIANDPQRTLGAAVFEEFGPRLPYLMKVLAAERPLSLQAHPSAAQARDGYAAGNRNYVDPYHKPELLVAVSEVSALCGFRDPKDSADLLDALGRHMEPVGMGHRQRLSAALDGVVARLRAGDLRAAVQTLLRWPAADRTALVSTVAGCDPLAGRLATQYPGDLGVVVALLLNHVTLAPGEAIWMPAGNLHAYLHGTGVEIMAASDNVLRGGLTPKHMDVAELLRVLRFEVLTDPVVRPVPVAPGVVTWPAPVREFALYRAELDDSGVELDLPGPRTALCMAGMIQVDDVSLRAGEAAFGPASPTPLTAAGTGTLYLAAVPALQ